MGTNIGGRLEGFRATDQPNNTIRFMPELFMTSPEEEQKRAAEAKAKEQAKPERSSAPGDAFSFVGQLVGDAKNLAVDAVSGQHSGDQVLSSINPELALQYQRGKEVQERIASGALKSTQLSETDRKNLDAFNNVRKSISQVPLYDRDSLTRYVEKGIEQKARTAPQEAVRAPAHDAVKPTPRDATKLTAHDAKPSIREAAKQTPHDVAKPAARDAAKPASHEAAKPNSHDAVKSALRDTSKPAPEGAKASATSEGAVKSAIAPAVAKPDASSDSKPVVARLVDQSAINSTRDGESKSPAISAFERRTGYDGRAQQESKAEVKQNPQQSQSSPRLDAQDKVYGSPQDRQLSNLQEKQNTSKSVDIGSPRETKTQNAAQRDGSQRDALQRDVLQRGEGVQLRTSFENMRRVLDERNSPGNSLEQKVSDKALKQQSQYAGMEVSQNPLGAERRLTLAEIRGRMPEQNVQQIIRISEERFPSGLRWQSNLRQPDVSPQLRLPHQSENSTQARVPQQAESSAQVRVPPQSDAAPQSKFLHTPDVTPQSKTPEGILPSRVQGEASGPVRTPPQSDGGPQVKAPFQSDAAGQSRSNTADGKLDSKSGTKSQSSTGRQTDGVRQPEGVRQPDGKMPASSARLPESAAAAKQTPPGAVRDGQSASAREQGVSSLEIRTLTFQGRIQDRYITGAEIALAAIIAAAGARRVRFDEMNPQGSDANSQIPKVQGIEAYLPNMLKPEQSQQAISKNAVSGQNLLDSKGHKVSQKYDGDALRDNDSDDVPGTKRYLQIHKYNRNKRLIGPHETFVSIAESTFELHHDARYAWLIADINLPNIKENYIDGKRIVEVRSRQLIDIPSDEDVAAFDRLYKEEFKPENLITIVIETQVDRELLNEHLGVFVEGGEKPAVSAGPGALPVPGAAPSLFSRSTIGGDAAVLPPLALNSAGILRVARQKLMDIAQQLVASRHKPISKFKDSLNRDHIKRRL